MDLRSRIRIKDTNVNAPLDFSTPHGKSAQNTNRSRARASSVSKTNESNTNSLDGSMSSESSDGTDSNSKSQSVLSRKSSLGGRRFSQLKVPGMSITDLQKNVKVAGDKSDQ